MSRRYPSRRIPTQVEVDGQEIEQELNASKSQSARYAITTRSSTMHNVSSNSISDGRSNNSRRSALRAKKPRIYTTKRKSHRTSEPPSSTADVAPVRRSSRRGALSKNQQPHDAALAVSGLRRSKRGASRFNPIDADDDEMLPELQHVIDVDADEEDEEEEDEDENAVVKEVAATKKRGWKPGKRAKKEPLERPAVPKSQLMQVVLCDEDDAPGQCGLRNLGNTCFMNSVLQALSNIAPLRQLMLQHFDAEDQESVVEEFNQLQDVPDNVDDVTLSTPLHSLMRVLWAGKYGRVTPYSMLDAVWKFWPHMRGYIQQDAAEFFSYMLAQFNDELLAKQEIPATPGAASYTHDIFGGVSVSRVECSQCNYTNCTNERFLNIELGIPVSSVARRRNAPKAMCSLVECFEAYTQWEDLCDGYRCSKCEKVVKARKRMTLGGLPPVLCLALKRFCYTSNMRLAKNDAQVNFPLLLNMEPFTKDEPHTPLVKRRQSLRSSAGVPIAKHMYQLRAVIEHVGLSMRKGHYTCYAFNDELDSWLHFDDKLVTMVDEEDVLAVQAYMLFYEKN